MIKYDINSFESFFTSIINLHPVYIEKYRGSYPIPDLEGVIYPFLKNDKIVITTVLRHLNTHIKYEEYKKTIINCKFNADTMAKVFTLSDASDLYNEFKSQHYGLFILDNTYEKYIENNN